jgi:glycosyltransferase involved in cell wall biosynthesis
MQEYATRDERIEIFHQENQGVGATRNHLLEKIMGDYILFVDSDDWVELNMVEFLVGKASENHADVVTCGNVINDSIPKAVYEEEIWSQEKVIKEFLRHVIFNGSLWNKLIKTRLLGNHRFDCTISYGEDALFCWYIIQNASKVIVTDRQFYHYRRNPQSLSRQKWTPEKNGSGHLAWEEIVKDVSKKWPQYLNITKARFAIEDFWGIYFAAISDYPYDEHIGMRQKFVLENWSLIYTSKLLTLDKLLVTFLLSKWYKFGKVIKWLKG